MSWRSLFISQPARLEVDQSRLAIRQQQTAYVPLADINVLVLDNRAITLSHPLLSACGDHGIVLFTTDSHHLPNAVLTGFNTHSRVSAVLQLQLSSAKPLCKQLWRAIVKAKITNQAHCLAMHHINNNALHTLAAKVRSGDPENRESQAAARYFPLLFGTGFHRRTEIVTNSALNYGYSIFRGVIARTLVAHGLQPALGIHHASSLNAFNLADDLLEPFRPMVDAYVLRLEYQDTDKLTTTIKTNLVDLLHYAWKTPAGITDGTHAIEQSVESLVRAMRLKQASQLAVPELIPLTRANRYQHA